MIWFFIFLALWAVFDWILVRE
jgi:hypothetical protein